MIGTLEDGSQFDSSRDRGAAFLFTIGQGQVIKGWDEGFSSMKVGEHAVLTIRSDYGYGPNGRPPNIPGGATLLFDVELLGFDQLDENGDEDIDTEHDIISSLDPEQPKIAPEHQVDCGRSAPFVGTVSPTGLTVAYQYQLETTVRTEEEYEEYEYENDSDWMDRLLRKMEIRIGQLLLKPVFSERCITQRPMRGRARDQHHHYKRSLMVPQTTDRRLMVTGLSYAPREKVLEEASCDTNNTTTIDNATPITTTCRVIEGGVTLFVDDDENEEATTQDMHEVLRTIQMAMQENPKIFVSLDPSIVKITYMGPYSMNESDTTYINDSTSTSTRTRMELPDIMAAASKYTHEVRDSHAGQDGIPDPNNKDTSSYAEQGEAILVESFLMGGLVLSVAIVAVVGYGSGQFSGGGGDRRNWGDASPQDSSRPTHAWVDDNTAPGFDRAEML
eukprot:scaffold100586_cov64-Attheya_sp.AAC.3